MFEFTIISISFQTHCSRGHKTWTDFCTSTSAEFTHVLQLQEHLGVCKKKIKKILNFSSPAAASESTA